VTSTSPSSVLKSSQISPAKGTSHFRLSLLPFTFYFLDRHHSLLYLFLFIYCLYLSLEDVSFLRAEALCLVSCCSISSGLEPCLPCNRHSTNISWMNELSVRKMLL
jgi:hypothetical protein